ncbi:hypothetical protein EDC04DRAFT_2904183 [Pisolithus marmoratus]|nr:hypothetical protein EDC04DRAFT_2904183 [Pisolithus marmoratus]
MGPTPNRPNIKCVSANYFCIWLAPGGLSNYTMVHHEQLRTYFHLPGIPAGYHQFREAYNHEAKTRARFVYEETDKDGEMHVVIPGPSPTREEVLGLDADLQSRNEIEGRQTLNRVEAEMLNSLLWGAAERIKCQRENSQRGYLHHHDHCDNDHNQRGPFARCPNDSPFDHQHSRKKAPSRHEKQSEKLKSVKTQPEYSTDLVADNLSSFFSDINLFPDILPDQPIAGPNSVTLDQLAASEPVIVAEEDGVYEEAGLEGIDDQLMEPDTTVEDAE